MVTHYIKDYHFDARPLWKLSLRLRKELSLTKVRVIWMGGRSFPAVDRRCGIFAENLERAFEEGSITSYEDDRLYDTDLIVQGLRTSDNATVYVAVEGAGVISAMDIDLARESADILTKLYDAPAISAVYGFTIAVEQRERAQPDPDAGLKEVHIFIEADTELSRRFHRFAMLAEATPSYTIPKER